MSKTIHIIGAGVAGLAAAIKLKNQNVILYEGTGKAGGRCYSFAESSFDNNEINNGSHLILECNESVLKYIREIGAEESFEAIKPYRYDFFDLKTGGRWSISKFPKISLKEAIKLLLAVKKQKVPDIFDTNSKVFKMFIEPLTVSALNTKPDKASAYILRNIILKMILTKDGIAPYLAKKPLSKCLIEPALEIVGDVRYNSMLVGLESEGDKITNLLFANSTPSSILPPQGGGREEESSQGDGTLLSPPPLGGRVRVGVNLNENDIVILALPPQNLKKILPELDFPTEFSSIMNVHFYLPDHDFKCPKMIGTINGLSEWIFINEKVISVTISSFENSMTKKDLAENIWNEVQKALNINIPLPKYKIIEEKKATFLATPENVKQKIKSPYKNLFIIGDFVNKNLPATLESAVSSGFNLARKIT